MTRLISLRTHNILDYLTGIFLVLCPRLFDMNNLDAARDIFFYLGGSLIGYSLLTNYSYSFARVIPLGVHMFLDVCVGFILLGAPWLMNYRAALTDMQASLHAVLGLGTLGFVVLTYPRTESERNRVEQRPTDIKKVA